MLEHLFSRSLTRYTLSSHAIDLDAFASTLAADGHSIPGISNHTRRLLRVLSAAKLPPNSSIGADVLRSAFSAWPAGGYVGT